MKNKDTISANDINKYMYCPYQWYYEKCYGIKELRRLKKELNEKYGYVNTSESNLKKGLDFHNDYYDKHRNKSRIKLILYSICFIAGIIFGAYFYFTLYR